MTTACTRGTLHDHCLHTGHCCMGRPAALVLHAMQAGAEATPVGCSCCAICCLVKDASTDLAAVVLLTLLLQIKGCLGGPARICRASSAQSGPASHVSLLRSAEAAAVPSMP